MPRRKPCPGAHHWVLGALVTVARTGWVHGRAAKCKRCGATTVLKEREHADYPADQAERWEGEREPIA